MSCNRVRRELLEHFRFREELGSRSGPHLAHLETCAACRHEVGIDRELVEQLRRALRERVEGSAPSAASWELVRQRTVSIQQRSWTGRVLQWGRLLPATVAGVMMFSIAIATGQADRLQSPAPAAPVVHADYRSVEAPSWEPPWWSKYRGHEVPPMPSGHMVAVMPDEAGTGAAKMPPVSGRLQ